MNVGSAIAALRQGDRLDAEAAVQFGSDEALVPDEQQKRHSGPTRYIRCIGTTVGRKRAPEPDRARRFVAIAMRRKRTSREFLRVHERLEVEGSELAVRCHSLSDEPRRS